MLQGSACFGIREETMGVFGVGEGQVRRLVLSFQSFERIQTPLTLCMRILHGRRVVGVVKCFFVRLVACLVCWLTPTRYTPYFRAGMQQHEHSFCIIAPSRLDKTRLEPRSFKSLCRLWPNSIGA